MWQIYEHRRLARRLLRLPIEVLKRYEKWKEIVQVSGPAALRFIKGFHDEALSGEWKGHRSSRLGDKHWVLYQVFAEEVRVHVIEIRAHNYRRK